MHFLRNMQTLKMNLMFIVLTGYYKITVFGKRSKDIQLPSLIARAIHQCVTRRVGPVYRKTSYSNS
jgi:hypothetical protein